MLSQEVVSLILERGIPSVYDKNEEFQLKHHNTNKSIDHHKNISYKNFFTDYLSVNKPCIIKFNEIEVWKSNLEWVTNGKPDFDFLKQNFGSSIVPVADCNIKEYNSQKKKSMVLADYIDYWLNLDKENNSELLYLKDWHFKREYHYYKAYETPEYFKSDWLNEYCENLEDDYQFVYMGPKGTWTPLHSDVFGSYSWSVNICGRKKWLLFPPGHERFLMNERKEVQYMVDESYLESHDIFFIKVIQEAGEVIFVPSGWYHQVWNLDDTISINHNWFNGCNITHIWNCLYQAALDVENEIADIKEFEGWEDQLQIILKAHHGMNYADFLHMLQFIVKSRTEAIKLANKFDINWHFVYDLLSISNLCLRITSFKIPGTFLRTVNNMYLEIKNFFCDTDDIKDLFVEEVS